MNAASRAAGESTGRSRSTISCTCSSTSSARSFRNVTVLPVRTPLTASKKLFMNIQRRNSPSVTTSRPQSRLPPNGLADRVRPRGRSGRSDPVRAPRRARPNALHRRTSRSRRAGRGDAAGSRPSRRAPASASSSRVPPHARGQRRAELPPAQLDGSLGVEPEVRQPVQQGVERDPSEVATEPRAEAEVRPRREREVRPLLAVDVEPVGVGEPARVAVRRREDRADERALGERPCRRAWSPSSSAGSTCRPAPPTGASPPPRSSRASGRAEPPRADPGRTPAPRRRARSGHAAPGARRTASASCSRRSLPASSARRPRRRGASTTGPSRRVRPPGGRGRARSRPRAPRSRRRPAPASPDRPRSSRGPASCPGSRRGGPPRPPRRARAGTAATAPTSGRRTRVKRSTSPRSANLSISSFASAGIIPCVRSSTSRGRNGASVIRRIRC